LLHIFISILGLWLLFAILRSMIRVALMNRHYRDFFADQVARSVYAGVALLIRRDRDRRGVHRVLLSFFPAYILSLITVYFVGAMFAFMFLYWGTGAVTTWRQAIIASGSALNTLGFATPTSIMGQWIAIPEGALGLGIVVFLFTFIPGYQAVIREREDQTSWLYVRTESHPSASAFFEWCRQAGISNSMRDVWETWERWFRMLGDTHSIQPVLTLSPSVQGDQSWVLAADAILEAAAFASSSMHTPDTESAKICVRTGARAFSAIADALGRTCAASRKATAGPSRAWYDAKRAHFCSMGLPIKSAIDTEQQWQEFVSLRGQYESALIFVAQQTFGDLGKERADKGLDVHHYV
jgi:hypothetical protein